MAEWMIKNKELSANKTYSVAFSDYLLKGFDIPFLTAEHKEVIFVYTPKQTELAFDIRKSVVSYLKK